MDNLDEDPRVAFMELVNYAQRRLAEKVAQLDVEDQSQWNQREELRHGFMNVVVAAAKRFEIEPFVSMEVPRYERFNEADHRQFTADVDHYLTQIMLDNSFKSRKNSVEILPASKEKIRKYVNGLRDCLEKSNMAESKRNSLLNRLNSFEAELEKRRTNLSAVALVAFEILGIPGSVWASAEITQKLVGNVMQVVAEARAEEQQTKQITVGEVPKALSPPRIEIKKKPRDLGDEIPF